MSTPSTPQEACAELVEAFNLYREALLEASMALEDYRFLVDESSRLEANEIAYSHLEAIRQRAAGFKRH